MEYEKSSNSAASNPSRELLIYISYLNVSAGISQKTMLKKYSNFRGNFACSA